MMTMDGRRRLNPEERKRMLLNCAVEVFSNRGIGRGGHTDIAEAAGVSVATVFNYFKSRELLVEGVLEEVSDVVSSVTHHAIATSDNPLDRITSFIDAFISTCEQKPDHMKIWIEWSASIRDELWPQYLAARLNLTEIWSKQIQTAIDTGQLNGTMPAHECAFWLLGNCQTLASLMFDPAEKKDDIKGLADRITLCLLNRANSSMPDQQP